MALFVLGCALAAPPSADSETLAPYVHKLVRQLDGPHLEAREVAETTLIKLGPAALELLPAPNDDMSAELRERLTRVRQKLQQAAADATMQPTTVTLNLQNAPLAKVIAALAKQSGNEVTDGRRQRGQPQNDGPLSITLDRVPFWKALDQVLDQTGLTVYPYEQGGLKLLARSEGQLPISGRAAYAGPFRLEAVNVQSRRDLRTAAVPTLLVALEVAWEPRLKPIALQQAMADVTAVDDRGQAMTVENPKAQPEAMPQGETVATDLAIPLLLPAPGAKEIASLKGTLAAMVPGKIETFRFPDPLHAKNVQQRIAAATVTLEESRKNGDSVWEVRMRLRFDHTGDALASHRNWILANEAYLVGADGKRINCDTSEMTMQSEREIGMAYLFALETPPKKLEFVYKSPGSIITSRLPWELRGIKLP
jgi:hypothetical protein